MKRLLTILLLLSMLCSMLPAAAWAEEPAGGSPDAVGISTAADLQSIAQDPKKSYILNNDLDLTGVDWTPFAFSGTLDGNGHTIYNLTIRNVGAEETEEIHGLKQTASVKLSGLFSLTDHAVIRDLHLVGVQAELDLPEQLFFGAFAGCAEETQLLGCSVEGRIRLEGSERYVGAGGLVGCGSSLMKNCSAKVQITLTDAVKTGRSNRYLGGMQAVGTPQMENCTAALDGYVYAREEVCIGGLLGVFAENGSEAAEPQIRECSAEGQVRYYQRNGEYRCCIGNLIGKDPSGQDLTSYNTGNLEWIQSLKNVVPDPEQCEEPQIEEKVVEPGCLSCGWTEHTCLVCGAAYRDKYTLPVHQPGEWRKKEGQPTVELRCCIYCGTVMEERTVAYWPKEEMLHLDRKEAELNYKKTDSLSVISADTVFGESRFIWTSSAPEIVSVDPFGIITAHEVGSAVIRCTSEDGEYADECTVHVTYSFSQQLIRYLLFGWLWY